MAEASTVRPALLQETLPDGRVRCGPCERRCGIAPGDRGLCGTRENREGTLHTLTWGLVASLAANPIEKKPLYHFFPGSVALTVGSVGCNLACPWCQNWELSRARPEVGRGLVRSQRPRRVAPRG